MIRKSYYLAVVLLILLYAVTVNATTYLIEPDGSGDYETIQAAISAATDGDIIELADGIFSGTGNWNINYLGKNLTVCSVNGNPVDCIVNVPGVANGVTQRGFRFSMGETRDAVLKDITIQGAYADDC